MLESCQCTIQKFSESLFKIQKCGYKIVSIVDAYELIVKKSSQKFAVITFDDVPDCVFINAYPFLKDHNIPFTVFVTTSFINQSPYLSLEHLLALNDETLCTIGAHTVSHPYLRSDKQAGQEIKNSKEQLELLIGKKISFFAYPYGQIKTISLSNIRMVEEAGYLMAFSAINATINDISSNYLWFLPRITLNDLDFILR
jgi:peptidoglycan/xylan/chitin deacetylase (PgdA/CDA1 family)